jgi:cyclic pyranopterin monophosphate synthase
MSSLSHFDDSGASRMVDVGAKPVTLRRARAGGRVTMAPETLRAILDRKISKGDVFEVARLAGIMGAKRTAELIPLCHPLGLDSVAVRFQAVDDRGIDIEATVTVEARTGVEMEALTAVTIAALTIYDMCKGIDRGITLGPFELREKSGGKSGHFRGGSEAS